MKINVRCYVAVCRYVPGVGFVDEHVGGTSSAATGFQTGDILMAGLPPLSATVPTQHEQVRHTWSPAKQLPCIIHIILRALRHSACLLVRDVPG